MGADTLGGDPRHSLRHILGFIALLSSRIYIDQPSNSTGEVEVPFLGKPKGNYPALVFVLLGPLWLRTESRRTRRSEPSRSRLSAQVELKKGPGRVGRKRSLALARRQADRPGAGRVEPPRASWRLDYVSVASSAGAVW